MHDRLAAGMLVLAIDTCLGACSAALRNGEGPRASMSEPMTKGHQERLAIMVGETMTVAGTPLSALDRIAVTVGPGSFTGLRVGLAFAKGLALALERPCVGVGTLEALACSVETGGWRVAAINAGRGQVYFQIFHGDHALSAPDILPVESACARVLDVVRVDDLTLVGPGAEELGKALPRARAYEMSAPSPDVVARLGARAAPTPARPFYLRPPDAKPRAS